MLFLAYWFNTTAFPVKWSFLILQNLIFSLPHDTRILFSNGENFIVLIGIGLLCLIDTEISSKFDISHIIIEPLFCSFPTVQRYLLSLFSVIIIILSNGVVNIFIHLPVSVFQIRIIEFVPSWLLNKISPWQAKIKLEIGFEWPK